MSVGIGYLIFGIFGFISIILGIISIVINYRSNSWKREMDKVLKILSRLEYPYEQNDLEKLEKALEKLPIQWHYLSPMWLELRLNLVGSIILKSEREKLRMTIEKIQSELHLKDKE